MVIGVTGGVGTGKSSVLEYLKNACHADIIMADEIAKELMMPPQPVYQAILQAFGPEILVSDEPMSPVNRAALAALVFKDREKLLLLNSLVHPAVKEFIREQIRQLKERGSELIVLETAILLEAGYHVFVDELWAIHTDYEVRVQRLLSSRGYSREKTISIMNSQKKPEEVETAADFVIDNSGDFSRTVKQIREHLRHAGIID